jgi:hypothetical protein
MRRILVALLVCALATPLAPATADEPPPVAQPDAPTEPAPTGASDGIEDPRDEPPADPGTGSGVGEPAPTPTVTLETTATTAYTGTTSTVAGRVEGADTPTLRVSRGSGGTWTPWNSAPVDVAADGAFTARLPVPSGTTTYRVELVEADAVTAASAPATLVGTAAPSTLTLTMPRSVVDYRSAKVGVRWRTADGRLPNRRVRLEFQRKGSRTWTYVRTLTIREGAASTSVRPRHDGRWSLRYTGNSTVRAVRSTSWYVDNRPPGAVVTLPRGAARPTITLPKQPRATRAEADVRVTRISDATWRSMKGRSWHAGCPLGRNDLRVVRTSYWSFDGYVRRGEIVVAARHAASTARVFGDLFRIKAPIRSMYRVDRFGYSRRVMGANDYASMAADNTSGFNCRDVVGRPGTRSPHAYGGSIDINPWENPFLSSHGYTPNGTWQNRTRPAAVTFRSTGDPVVTVLRRHGFRWLGYADLHHFQR